MQAITSKAQLQASQSTSAAQQPGVTRNAETNTEKSTGHSEQTEQKAFGDYVRELKPAKPDTKSIHEQDEAEQASEEQLAEALPDEQSAQPALDTGKLLEQITAQSAWEGDTPKPAGTGNTVTGLAAHVQVSTTEQLSAQAVKGSQSSVETGGTQQQPTPMTPEQLLKQLQHLQQQASLSADQQASVSGNSKAVSEAFPQSVFEQLTSRSSLNPQQQEHIALPADTNMVSSAVERLHQTLPFSSLASETPELPGAAAQSADTAATTLLDQLSATVHNPSQSAPQPAISQAGLAANSARSPAQQAVTDQPLNMIHDPEWPDDLGQRLFHMSSNASGLKEARLRLDPPSMGTLDIQLRVDDNKLTVQFHSASPQVREMLMSQMDRLRSSFDGSNMNLVDVDVSSGNSSEQHRDGESLADNGHSRLITGHNSDETEDAAGNVQTSGVTSLHRQTLLSTYA